MPGEKNKDTIPEVKEHKGVTPQESVIDGTKQEACNVLNKQDEAIELIKQKNPTFIKFDSIINAIIINGYKDGSEELPNGFKMPDSLMYESGQIIGKEGTEFAGVKFRVHSPYFYNS